MTIFKWHIWHSWKPIKQKTVNEFMGEKYTKYEESKYRICTECKEIQKFNWCSQGGYWSKIEPEKYKILNQKILWTPDIGWTFKHLVDYTTFKPPGSKKRINTGRQRDKKES